MLSGVQAFSLFGRVALKGGDAVKQGLDQIDQRGEQVGGRMEQVGQSMQRAGRTMGAAGATLTKSVTGPILGLATAAGYTVAKFDDSMSKVQAISGATGEELESLRDLAQELGSQTAHSASQAADAMSYLALAGWDTNQILEATPDMLALASAGSLDLARAADIVTDTMSAFGMAAEEAGVASDVFAMASARSNTSVEQLGEAMKYAAPVAAGFGADLEQTSAIAGMMADAGIKGSQAGTALRAGFTRLAAPTGDAAAMLEDLGVATQDADGNMRDITAIIADLQHGMGDMAEGARTQAMQTIFGTQAMAGWSAVMSAGTDRMDELTEELYNSEGAAEDMAETMEDNLAGAMRQMRSMGEGILIQLGDLFVPLIMDHVIPAMQRAGEWISSMIDRFEELDPSIQAAIGAAIAFAVGIGPILMVAGKVVTILGVLVAAIGAVSAPVLLVVGALAALVAGFVRTWRQSEEFRDNVISALSRLRDRAQEIFTQVQEVAAYAFEVIQEVIGSVLDGLQDSFEHFVEAIGPAWESFLEGIEAFKPVLKGVLAAAGVLLATFLAVATGVFNGIIRAIGPVIEAFGGLLEFLGHFVQFVGALFRGDLAAIFEHLKGMASGLKTFVVGVFSALGNFIWGFVEGVIGFFQSLYNAILGNSIIPDLVTGIQGWIESLVGIFQAVWAGIETGVAAFRDMMIRGFVTIRNTVGGIINGLISGLESGFNYIIRGVNSFISGINSTIRTLNRVPGVNLPTIGEISRVRLPRVNVEGLAEGGDVLEAGAFRVGERGVEEVYLPAGAAVRPAEPEQPGPAIDYEKLAEAVTRNLPPMIDLDTTINSPDPLDAGKVKREQKKMLQQLALKWGAT